ncbi:MAG: response regulator transcription factor [Chloroflexi bacterium]|nr:response regulator transcription factor [Chloroflexota bacterium]
MHDGHILIIDDDAILVELLAEHLKTVGFDVALATNGREGLRLADEIEVDLVVLDVMMPSMDGWEVCRRLRQARTTPIIMLTAKGQEVDKLRGFRLGVDDYVTKPFSFAELTARIGAVLARARHDNPPGRQFVSDDLMVDLEQQRVTLNGEPVDLTPTEYRLLALLARRPHRTVSTEQLLMEVWGPEYAGEVQHVKHYIWSLRQKIETDPGDPRHIITQRGFGYRLE